MHAFAQFISLPSLDSAIDFSPLTVTPNTPLSEVVSLMRNSQPQASYVLIVENSQVLGWFTEHEALQILYSDVDLQTAQISEVMVHSALTLKCSEVFSLASILTFLRQHHLSLVPLIDEQGQFAGIVTYKSICKALEQQAEETGGSEHEAQRRLLEASVINANDAIVIIEANKLDDPLDWCLVYANEAFTCMSGWSADEVIGKTQSILYGEKTSDNELDRIRVALSEGSSIRTEFIWCHKNSSKYWVEVNISPITSSKDITHFVAISRDITERKLAEEALHSSEELFRQIAENIRQVLFVRDPMQDKIIYINPAYEEIWGRSRANLYERSFNFLEAVHPLDRNHILDAIAYGAPKAITYSVAEPITIQQLNHLYTQEYRIIRPDGEERWISTQAVPLKNELGEVYRIVEISEDITDQKRAIEALRESEERFRTLADKAPVLIWMNDANGLVTFCNQFCLDFTGRSLKDLLNGCWVEGIHPEDRQNCFDIYISAFKNHLCFQYICRYLRADGEYRWLLNLGVPRFASDGSFIGYIGCCTDITERKQAEAALQQAQADLEKRIEQKTRAVKEMNRQLIFEMTDRLYIEEQLRQSQEMLQLVMDNIPQNIFWKDTASVYLGCNRNFAKTVGLESPEDVVGKTDYDLVTSQQEADFHRESDLRVMQTDTPEYHVIFPHLRKDGTQIWLEASKIPLHDGEGNVMGVLATFEDITERKQAQEALKRSKERFQNLVEISSDLVWEVDENCFYSYVSPKVHDILGYHPQEVLGKSPFDLMPPQEAERVAELFASITATQQPFQCLENTNRHKEGHLVILETSGVPIFDAEGQFRGYRGIDRDITERKRSEESLQLRDRAIAASSNGIMIADVTMPNSPIIYANPALEEITGYSVAEVLGKNCCFLHGADINQPGITILYDAIAQGKSCTVVVRNYRKNGALFWNEISISPVYDNHGQFTHYIAIQTDITERKQAEVALLVSQERLQYLLSSSPGVIYSCKIYSDYGITFMSENVVAMLGYEAQEFMENRGFWASHVHPEDLQQVFSVASKLIEQGQHSHEYRFLHKNGTYRWMYDQAKLVQDDAGNPLEIVGYWLDITERKQLEEELKASLHKEKELNELKSRFVSMTSHEFRTPLSTILSSSELLEHYRHKWTEEKQLSHLHRIQSAVQHMTEMLNNVLVIGKAEAGKLQFIPKAFDLVEYCHYLVEELQLNVNNQHAIKFSSQYKSMPCCMDEKLLGHILSNLLSNAIKYSPTGSTVKFTLAFNNSLAIFTIQDQGIGIPPEDFPHLFESFHRATNVGNIQGTGLGLAIVKKCVDVHDGEISVKSEVGVGTIFSVTLPLNNQIKL
jgi:PAS domain S-box-containing protein